MDDARRRTLKKMWNPRNHVTEIQNSATSVIPLSKNAQNHPTYNLTVFQDAALGAEDIDHSARTQDSAPKDPTHSGGRGEKREPFDINPDDFKKLDLPLRDPCDRCGTKYVEYIERLTPGRMARKNEPSRRICKKCFKAAKNRKAKSFRVLPGSLNVAGMRRIYVDVGRCSVCNTEKAVWKDPENRISICETCYVNAGGGSIKEESA